MSLNTKLVLPILILKLVFILTFFISGSYLAIQGLILTSHIPSDGPLDSPAYAK